MDYFFICWCTAEIWFDSLAGLEAVLTSKTYREKVFPDESTFLDHEHTLITIGDQMEIIGDYSESVGCPACLPR